MTCHSTVKLLFVPSTVGFFFFMMNDSILKIICAAEATGELDEPTSSKINRKYWVHPLNSKRDEENSFLDFYDSIRIYPEKFFEYYRMSITSFDELLDTMRPHLGKQFTNMRKPISVELRLTITIR